MSTPPAFAPPPTMIDPATGEPVLAGRDNLPWAIDTLATGGTIRSRLIRLQQWVNSLLAAGEQPRR